MKLEDLSKGSRKSVEAMLKARRTHRMSGTKVYKVWASMKDRCLNTSSADYHRYGGRGLTISEDWKIFENFYRDMGEPNGLTLERRENSKGYSKENCIWATRAKQNINKRSTTYVLLNGVKTPLSVAAKNLNVYVETFRYRIKQKTFKKFHPEVDLYTPEDIK